MINMNVTYVNELLILNDNIDNVYIYIYIYIYIHNIYIYIYNE